MDEPIELQLAAPEPIHWSVRCLLVVFGLGMTGLLVTAFFLEPSPRGFGTHQQLGLPPCSFIDWWGVPCPSCGMTTSWAYMTKAQVFSSFQANPGGAILALICAAMGPWLVMTGIKGDWFIGVPPNSVIITIGSILIVVILTNWIWQVSSLAN